MAHTYQKQKEKEKTKIFVTEECLRALNISFVCVYSQLLSFTPQEGPLFFSIKYHRMPTPFMPRFQVSLFRCVAVISCLNFYIRKYQLKQTASFSNVGKLRGRADNEIGWAKQA